ncbi:MAG: DNA repair protein RecO [Gammaproteobacteria bacterium]|nr:DNA repair protein RecO [Gammaproteobacteria bacterium]MDH4252895.1 DNA repair protein RecO [Gammaproteobacteria bacterium]MDH5308419.1 DNA repair protein RecO [Gammaproteobacteria bacterium]
MSGRKRVEGQPAWLLHYRPFRDTSLILDLITRDHGRLSVVARGSRSARSRLRGILRPFLPLSISWVGRAELGTMTGAEMNGPPVRLLGDALMSGYYLNELLLKLVPRHDPQPEIFEAYAATIFTLQSEPAVARRLREFELELLRLLGYAVDLESDSGGRAALRADLLYEYRVEQGAVPVSQRDGPMIFSGAELQAVARRDFDRAEVLASAARLLRGVIAYHLDGRELLTRKVLRDMRRTAGPEAGRED